MGRKRRTKYTKALLEEAVRSCETMAGVLRYLNLKNGGGTHRMIQDKIRVYDIDTSHFKGQSWQKGLSKDTSSAVHKQWLKNRIPNAEVFIENCPHTPMVVRKRFLEVVAEYQCAICKNNGMWNGKQLTLHVDHINGIGNDNRLTNLRLLCPNCHQQTETWGNKS